MDINMNASDFWNNHNHCPYCRWYTVQSQFCDNCKFYLPINVHEKFDNFQPKEEYEMMLEKYESK